jgi:hypothetical protein
MDKALDKFHVVKDAFINLKLRQQAHFNFLKLHAMQHYTRSIRLLGLADGFNTEASERLHIDYAKEAFKASNRRDYVAQMTTWLHRQETVEQYTAYLDWLSTNNNNSDVATIAAPSQPSLFLSSPPQPTPASPAAEPTSASQPAAKKKKRRLCTPPVRQQGNRHEYSIAAKPSGPGVPAVCIAANYAAPNFLADVSAYLKKTCPGLTADKLPGPLDRFGIFPQMTVYLPGQLETSNMEAVDHIACAAAKPRRAGFCAKPARFDTVLVAHPDHNAHTVGTSLKGKSFIFTF